MDISTLNRLDPRRPYKPLDFGNGLLAGCVAPNGRMLNLGTYHPIHGYMTLSAIAPFPAEQRHDQPAVRAYRAALAQPGAPTFGLRPSALDAPCDAFLLADAIPHSRFSAAGPHIQVTTWAPCIDGRPAPCAVQQWLLHNPGDQPISWDATWDGRLALNRASYTQLTERGLIGQPGPALELVFDGRQLSVIATDAGAAAVILGLPAVSPWRRQCDGPYPVTFPGHLTILPGQTVQHTLIYALSDTVEQAAQAAALAAADLRGDLEAALDARRARWRRLDPALPEPARPLAHRAQSYVLDCCALPVAQGICLLTDHQILPLSWTRDAYFLIQGLCPASDATVLELWRRHLLWLFEIARRPDGHWGRAYLANGHPKDNVFQLDQQCYPLLELAEYAAFNQDEATVARLARHIPSILEIILARRAPQAELFATEETPADDPLPLPYHFSSQVLLWHTLRQLAALNAGQRFTSLELVGLAAAIRAATEQYFVAEHQQRRLFAYATDLHGTYRFYHDANDLPTVLAPVWGFCAVNDPIWRATMDFAFSPDNQGGYYPGAAGGLGSVHTPAPWPLGDVQELLYARLIGDAQRFEHTLARLAATACWDAALPEARDARTGAVRSRHWFAWPGAALVAALVHPAWQHRDSA